MVWWFVVQLIITIAMMLWARSKRKDTEDTRDATLSSFNFSMVRYGVPLPIVYGYARVGGLVIDQGDFRVVEKQEEYGGGGSLGGSATQTWFEYRIRQQIAITAGTTDGLVWYEIGTNVKDVNYTRSGEYVSLPASDIVLSGRFYWGGEQSLDEYLDGYFGHNGNTPNYKCITYAVFDFDLGTMAQPPSSTYIVKRYVNLLPIAAQIGDDANPAQIIYDIIVNGMYGLRYPLTKINTQSFIDVGTTLLAEGLGASITLGPGEGLDLKSSIDTILEWIDGAIVDDEGLLTLKLRRFDYVVANITEITAADIAKGSIVMRRPGIYNTKNAINFSWNDRTRKGEKGSIALDDAANLVKTTMVRAADYDFSIQTNKVTAEKVAARLLRASSYPIATLELILKDKTKMSTLAVFDVFKLNYSKFGIASRVFRIINKTYQTDRTCKIEALEEFNAAVPAINTQDGEQGPWEDTLVRDENWTAIFFENEFRGVYAGIKRSNVNSDFIGVMIKASSTSLFVEPSVFLGVNVVGTLKTAITSYDTEMSINKLRDFAFSSLTASEFAAGTYAFKIDNEIIYARVGESTGYGYDFFELYRGAEGTDPAQHDAASDVVYLIPGSKIQVPTDAPAGLYTLTITPAYPYRGVLLEDSAYAITQEFTYQSLLNRLLKPANIQIDSQGNINTFISNSNVTFNWRETSHQGGAGLDGAGMRAPNQYTDEVLGFKIEVLNEALELKATYTTTDPTWEYTYAQRTTDGIGVNSFYIRIYQTNSWTSGYTEYHAVAI